MKKFLEPVSETATDAKGLISNAKNRSEKAVKIAEQLALKEMTPDHKEKCLKFIANAKNAEAELKAERMPLTRRMDKIKSDFTATEKAIKQAAEKVQRSVNAYVTKLAKEAQAKEQAIRNAANLERRKLEFYDEYFKAFTASMRKALDTITLDNYIDKKYLIEKKKFRIKRSHFASFEPKQPESWIDEMAKRFEADIEDYRMQLLEFLPELKKQLLEGKETKLSEKVEIKETIKEDVQATKINELDQLMNMDEAPESKRYFEIELLTNKGMIDLFNFWYLNEGLEMPLDKVATMSIDRMRKFAEKKANKGEFIESENLKYDEKYKV